MRLERKNRTDISYKSSGGLFDLFDNAFKETWRVTDGEYDYVCEVASDEDLDAFTENLDTFSKKRTALIIYIKLMTAYNKSK